MANKIYPDFTAGSFAATKIFLIADPVTGALVKVTLQQILDAVPSGVTPGIDDVLAVGQSLTADRETDLDGHTIEFENGNFYCDIGTAYLFYVQNGDNNYLAYFSNDASYIRGHDPTGGGNIGVITGDADDEKGRFQLSASFNNGAEEAKITGTAQNGVTIIIYEADTQELRGQVIIADLAGGGTTGLSIDNDGKIIRTP